MAKARRYRVIFAFDDNARNISIDKISDVLAEKGEKTFETKPGSEVWHHKVYDSEIVWSFDSDSNVLVVTISDGEVVRTCGSLIEGMLRNAGDFVTDVERDLKGVSVFG